MGRLDPAMARDVPPSRRRRAGVWSVGDRRCNHRIDTSGGYRSSVTYRPLTSRSRDRRLICDAMNAMRDLECPMGLYASTIWPVVVLRRASDCPLIDKITRLIWITARRLRILFHSSCRCIGDGKEV
jgi:hypothetical protein